MENISVHVKYLFACEAVRRWAAWFPFEVVFPFWRGEINVMEAGRGVPEQSRYTQEV